jgi:hypothetical protein
MNRRPLPEIEKMLAADSVGSTDDWRRVKDYLARSFTEYLGQEIEPVWEPFYEDIIHPGGGFSFGIQSRRPLAGPLAIEWYGVISHEHGHTCASVLLFAQDKRILPEGGADFLYFEFTTTPEGAREWQSRGWYPGDCGEWEGYQRMSEVCRGMREAQESRR